MAEFLDAHFFISGTALLLSTVFCVGGTIYLAIRKFRPRESTIRFQTLAWFGIQFLFAIHLSFLLASYFATGHADRQANGLALYLIAIWSAPAITCGVLSLALRPSARR
ncbi:hypothetical protein [Niveibacterium sp. SC-1]|uniref:hypothetical protein n=1 Tax=Niveibacterium sp. SC-1 TaxID=3135646 RepID=UPI00311F96BD